MADQPLLFLPLPTIDDFPYYYDFGKVFSDEECDEILGYAGEFKTPLLDGTDIPNESYTNTKIAQIGLNEDTFQFYNFCTQKASEANKKTWKFDLSASLEPIDVIQYDAGGSMNWHMDYGPGMISRRKINIIVQLSDINAYDGGWLDVMTKPVMSMSKTRGTMIAMPSFIMHRVRPVTSGIRRSMVLYCHGTHFK
jgi:PKHD-type hydroxylase